MHKMHSVLQQAKHSRIVQVANVTYLGYLTPLKPPVVPLLYFDLPPNHMLDGVPDNG